MAAPQKPTKVSYTVMCSSSFRREIEALAQKKNVNVADLARSVILTLPEEFIETSPDPGDPDIGDRDLVTLKSGVFKGKLWARKPRLQMRLPGGAGYSPVFIRKALGIALAMGRGTVMAKLENAQGASADSAREKELEEQVKEQEGQLERLKTVVAMLSFEPLPKGIHKLEEALYVFGFPPFSIPDRRSVVNRYRLLATIHHPDGELGSHKRMSQLNAAMDLFKQHFMGIRL